MAQKWIKWSLLAILAFEWTSCNSQTKILLDNFRGVCQLKHSHISTKGQIGNEFNRVLKLYPLFVFTT